jgi:methylase of polypeptide subunit release factors
VAAIEADSDPVLKAIAKKIKHWNPFDDSQASPFFSPTWMFGIDKGFDVVIGNPPYVQLQKDSGRLAKMFENEGYKTFERTGDIYSLFYEHGCNILIKKEYYVLLPPTNGCGRGMAKALENILLKILILFY